MDAKRKTLISTFTKYNTQLNLSAIREPDQIFTKHIQDAIELQKICVFTPGSRILDIGTGGGFPLLPLAMTYPDCKFTGIDARQKKVKAINTMIEELDSTNAKALWTRIESHDQKYDYITARAVAYIDTLRERSQHLIGPTTKLILFKLRSDQEHTGILKLCKQNKLLLEHAHKYQLYDQDVERVIYIVSRK